ncbi:MAG: hypothetical protein RR346_09935, partial [Bacteroidales bacterium]
MKTKLILTSLLLICLSVSMVAQNKNKPGVRMARYSEVDDLYFKSSQDELLNKNKTAGFYLQRGAIYKGSAIGSGVVGGILGGILMSSDKKDTRNIGYAATGVFGAAAIGLYIASIICENNAGKILDIEMGHIRAKIGLADSGT